MSFLLSAYFAVYGIESLQNLPHEISVAVGSYCLFLTTNPRNSVFFVLLCLGFFGGGGRGGGVFLFRFVLIKAVFKFTYYKSVSLIVND